MWRTEPRTKKNNKKTNKKIKKTKKTLKRNPEAKCMVCTWLKKLLSINYEKSKYLIIGGAAYRRQTFIWTAKILFYLIFFGCNGQKIIIFPPKFMFLSHPFMTIRTASRFLSLNAAQLISYLDSGCFESLFFIQRPKSTEEWPPYVFWLRAVWDKD